MKRFISVLLAALMVCTGMPYLAVTGFAADTPKLYATVGDNNTHLLPSEYDRNVKKYQRGTLTEEKSWTGWAWKNDHANSRLDFYTTNTDIPQATLSSSDFTTKSGATIKKENITVTYIDKVNTLSKAYPGINYEAFDIISRKTVRDLEAGQIYEAWVDISVPADAQAGMYSGKLYLKSGSETLAEFSYKLEVLDMTLTDPEDWETYFELWTYPYASNRYYSGKTDKEYFKFTTDNDTNPYSLYYVRLDKKYEAGLESQLELYHQAGGNAITVSIVEDPWNSRYPCACPSMIKWTKHKDGTFSFDYTDMDYWIELNMKHGINRQINLYSLAGVGWGFVYYDEASGTVKNDGGGGPGGAGWKKISTEFLKDLIAHLEEKGWFDLACLQMDERTYPWTKAVLDLAETVPNSEGKTLKVGGAVNATEVSKLYDRMADISLWENILTSDMYDLTASRKKKGLRTTIYTCGAGKMSTPNQPSEAAYAVYSAAKYGADGIMRWALDKFDYDPLHAECHDVTYPGDCYLIYPDEKDSTEMKAQSTPRYEKLCEGMRNMEKVNLIRKNYPSFDDMADDLISSLTKGSLTTEAARIDTRVLSLSRAVLSFENNQFTDVKSGKWYNEAVRFAVVSGLMNGVSGTKFAPDGSMTRAMFVTVLARMDGAKLDNGAKPIFDDVPTGKWYTGAIVWATRSSLVDGVAPGKFAPNSPLTREQTATLLLRYAQRKEYDTEPRADIKGYEDYRKIGSYARDAFSWANAKGIIKGVSATRLDPKGNCTRAQVAEMLRLFSKNIVAVADK